MGTDPDAWALDKDAGDYRILLKGTVVQGGPYVASVDVRGKSRADPQAPPYEVTREVLAYVVRHLPQLADEGLAVHRSTEVIPFGPGTVTMTNPDGSDPFVFPVRGGAVTRRDMAKAHDGFLELQSARRRRLTREDLQEVAQEYLDAKADGRPVTAAVAAARSVGESRAAHLIKEARKAGLLPPVEKRGNSNAEDE